MHLPRLIAAALVSRQSVMVLPTTYCSPDCRKFYLLSLQIYTEEGDTGVKRTNIHQSNMQN